MKGGNNEELNTLLSKLGLHKGDQNEQEKVFLKTKPEVK